MTGTYTNALINGNWHFLGTSAAGTITFNNANAITAGSLTADDGSTFSPTGTYTLDPAGTLVVNAASGAMSPTHDLIALSDPATPHALTLLVSTGAATYANADLKGKWTFAFDGDAPASNGVGSLTLDALGHITSGTAKDGTHSVSVTGTYTLDANTGACTFSLHIGATTVTYSGTLNASKDLLALTPPDLQAAATANGKRLIVATKSAGAYTKADAAGTWTIATDNAVGTVTLDALGHITGGTLTTASGDAAITGSYTLSSAGLITFNIITNSTPTSFSGAMNASRNAIVMNHLSNSTASVDNLMLLLNTANHPPTLTAMKSFLTAVSGQPFTLTFEQLKAAATNCGDLDGDTLQFQINALNPHAALRINGNLVTTFPALLSAGATVTWTPTLGTVGTLTAFTLRAYDGVAASAKEINCLIKTVAPPVVSIATTRNASEANPLSTGAGTFTLTRSGGDLTRSLTVYYTVGSHTATSGSDFAPLSGVATFDPNKTTTTITLTPVDDALDEDTENVQLLLTNYTMNTYSVSPSRPSAILTIADNEPTISVAATKPKTTEIPGAAAAQFTLTRTGGSLAGALTVAYTLSGTATNTVDYATLPGTVTFAPGSATAVVSVAAVDDGIAEPPETIKLTLTASSLYALSPALSKQAATVTIVDAQVAPVSVAGDIFNATITSGTGAFNASGTFQIVLNPSDNRYLLIGGPGGVPSSTGTYAYALTTGSGATLSLTDSRLGTVVGTITFTSPTTCNFAFTHSGDTQTGTMAVTLPTASLGFAPAAGAGFTSNATITAGSGIFSPTGTFQFVISASPGSTAYVIAATPPNAGSPSPSSIGHAVYEKFAPNVALITYVDSVAGEGWMTVFFSSNTAAAFVSTCPTGAQRGTFTVASQPLTVLPPSLIAGRQFNVNISGGTSPFPSSGSYRLNFSPANIFFTLTNGSPGIPGSSGQFTYERFSNAIALLRIDDDNSGDSVCILNFNSSTSANFLLYNEATSAWQTGFMTLLPPS